MSNSVNNLNIFTFIKDIYQSLKNIDKYFNDSNTNINSRLTKIEDNQLMAILNTIYPFLQATSIILAEYHKDDRIKNIYAKWIKAKNLELNYTQMKDSDNLSNADHWWGGLGAYVVTKKDITVK